MSLTGKTVNATSWAVFGAFAHQFINVARLAIFAHILAPSDFGVYAMVLVFYVFLEKLGDAGTSAALVQRRELNNTVRDTVFFFNIAFGFGFTCLFFFLANVIADINDTPALISLIQTLSPIFLISSLGYVQSAMLRRHLKFKKATQINLFANFIASIVSLIAAAYGAGVYSLVVQMLVHSLLQVIFLWVSSNWRPNYSFNTNDVSDIFSFTAGLTGYNVISYVANNLDKFFIGKFMGPTLLGHYYIAYRIIIMTTTQLLSAFRAVLFSSFSSLDDEEKYRNSAIRVLLLLSTFFAPAIASICALADVLVDVLVGSQWGDASLVLMIFSSAAYMQALFTFSSVICLSKARSDILFWFGVLQVVLLVVGISFLHSWGIIGVSIAFTISVILTTIPFTKKTFQLIGVEGKTVLTKVSGSIFTAIGIGFFIYACKLVAREFISVPSYVELFILTGMAILVSLVFISKEARTDMKKLLHSRKN